MVLFFIFGTPAAIGVELCIDVVSRTHTLSWELQEPFIPASSFIPKTRLVSTLSKDEEELKDLHDEWASHPSKAQCYISSNEAFTTWGLQVITYMS